MSATPRSIGAIAGTTANEVDQLECPRCRRPPEGRRRRGEAHCPSCGLRLVRSVRQSEAEAWRQLYGGPPVRLR